MPYSYDRRTAAEAEVLTPAEVEKLPVGSLVFEWKDGLPNGSALVVLEGGKVMQVAHLPNRAGQEPPKDAGSEPHKYSAEFALIMKGKGKLMTHDTAVRNTINWRKSLGPLKPKT